MNLHNQLTAQQRVMATLARTSSRRSLLGRAGRTILVLTGVATIPMAVSTITPKVARATHDCFWGWWCGLCGKPCSSCGGTTSSCPSGGYGSGYWARCCQMPDGTNSIVEYHDCCLGYSCGHAKCYNLPGCTDPYTSWCDGGGTYTCTVAVITSLGC